MVASLDGSLVFFFCLALARIGYDFNWSDIGVPRDNDIIRYMFRPRRSRPPRSKPLRLEVFMGQIFSPIPTHTAKLNPNPFHPKSKK